MSTLVLVEHDNKIVHPSTRNALAAALELDDKPTLLVIGHECKSVAEQAASFAGAHVVWCIDKPCYKHPVAEQISDLVLSFARSFDNILVSASTFGKILHHVLLHN